MNIDIYIDIDVDEDVDVDVDIDLCNQYFLQSIWMLYSVNAML